MRMASTHDRRRPMTWDVEDALDVARADLRYAEILHRFFASDESEETLRCARLLFAVAHRAATMADDLAAYARSLGHPRVVVIEDRQEGRVRNLRRDELVGMGLHP